MIQNDHDVRRYDYDDVNDDVSMIAIMQDDHDVRRYDYDDVNYDVIMILHDDHDVGRYDYKLSIVIVVMKTYL